MHIIHDMALSRDQIYKLNLCRLYKRITFLSEILHHDHIDFEPTLWKPEVQSHQNPNERYPIIEIPKPWWTLWKTVLQAIIQNNRISINNFGKHTSPSTVTWLTTTDTRYIYCKHGQEYNVHKLLRNNKNKYYYDSASLFQTTLENFVHLKPITSTDLQPEIMVRHHDITPFERATKIYHNVLHQASIGTPLYQEAKRRLTSKQTFIAVQSNDPKPPMTHTIEVRPYEHKEHSTYRKWWTHQYGAPSPKESRTVNTPIPITFDDGSDIGDELAQAITKLSPQLQRNLGHISQITHLPSLLQAFGNGDIVAVCDASVSGDDYGAHAYTIVSKNEQHRLWGCAPVDCDEDDIESTRTEKSGVLALSTLIGIFDDIADSGSREVYIYMLRQPRGDSGRTTQRLHSILCTIHPTQL